MLLSCAGTHVAGNWRTGIWIRTILSLVYTALKLCIDIDPALFDECANEYKNQRQLERKHQKEREENWRHLQQKVERMSSTSSQHHASEVPYRMGAEAEEYNTNSGYMRAESPNGMPALAELATAWKITTDCKDFFFVCSTRWWMLCWIRRTRHLGWPRRHCSWSSASRTQGWYSSGHAAIWRPTYAISIFQT